MTDNAFHPVRHRRTFEEILDQFEQAITSGNLSPGDRLPSERELASRLGVSRTSVREALRVLEALRIVEVKSGAENGVTLLRQPGNALPYLIKLYLSLGHVSVQSVIDFLIDKFRLRRGAILFVRIPQQYLQLTPLVGIA